jgi:SAM-dependent methyltransferase
VDLRRWFGTWKKHQSLIWEPAAPLVSLDADGRRHRDDIPYLFPKDEKEVNRLDYQHYILRQLLKGNLFAPAHDALKRGGNVLDVGCGTGRWGHEVAASYSQAQVVGLDIENLSHASHPPRNYQFHQGDILHGLPFPAQQFLYTHQRLLVAALPLNRWPFVIGELKRVTVPSGWIELVEMGTGFHRAGPATQQFLAWWVAISAQRGIDASKMALIGGWLGQVGLSSIQTETKILPVGRWGGRLGSLFAQNVVELWRSMKPYTQSIGIHAHTFDAVINDLQAEWNTNHTTFEVYYACGQV